MQRKPVESSAVLSYGYDPHFQSLQVEYANGRLYEYFPVPAKVYEELEAAPSKGAYVNLKIKPYFKCREIERTA